MTAQARITQADMQRAVNAARKAGGNARIVIDLANQKLEIILGEAALEAAIDNPWDDDDA